MTLLRFCALQSCVDASFWSELGERKLNEYQLCEAAVPLNGRLQASRHATVGGSLLLSISSFTANGASQGAHTVPGLLYNTNTREAFLKLGRVAILGEAAQRTWDAICSGAAEADPALLSPFIVTAFGDLKQWDFAYWVCFPALKPPAPYQQLGSARSLVDALGATAAAQAAAACDAWRGADSGTPTAAGVGSLGSAAATRAGSPPPFWLVAVWPGEAPARPGDSCEAPSPSAAAAPRLEAWPLSHWRRLRDAAADGGGTACRVLLAMSDPSALPLVPGWPLRNALLLASRAWGATSVGVLCCRDAPSGRCDPASSFLVDVELPPLPPGWCEDGTAPAALGWEADSNGKAAPRHVSLAPLLNPLALAEQAVDLNLRLMRWRAAPDLRVDAMAQQRCLLLGAGTLGCSVARCLLAWGVRHVTLVDSGKVSFSNPVRQSLFTYEDCLAGGRPKAEAAAEQLRAIFPAVQADGVALSIPMPGHPPANAADAEEMEKACQALDALVAGHDAVFLLTDTRESRWLPALMAAAHGKVAITAALGFDGLLVMRHGVHDAPRIGAPPVAAPPPPPPPPPSAGAAGPDADAGDGGAEAAAAEAAAAPPEPQGWSGEGGGRRRGGHGPRLGCYFCNDVVAPLNSMRDRSLDQQCTVSRPGLAPIAGALAVEMLAALVQHPLQGRAPAAQADGGGGVLGPVPHMLRCQLTGFTQTSMHGEAFAQCTACSPLVADAYARRGWDFVHEAVRDPAALEALTGLSKLHECAAEVWDDDEEEEEEVGA